MSLSDPSIPSLVVDEPVTISQDESLSPAIPLKGNWVVGLAMPAAWDAAALTFQASVDGVIYNNVYDDAGTEKSVVIAASRYVVLDPLAFPAAEWLKIRSGTAATPVAQTAARTLTLMVKIG